VSSSISPPSIRIGSSFFTRFSSWVVMRTVVGWKPRLTCPVFLPVPFGFGSKRMMVPSVGAVARGRSRSFSGEDDPEQAGMPAREMIEIAKARDVSA
jgi:hypothetical protein